MPLAKPLFLERMQALERSVGIDAVTNRALTEQNHNDVARMLRNGLAVVGFAALEDFIKTRTAEVLGEVGRTTVTFDELPEILRYATTSEAISAISYQLSIRPKVDRISYVQEQAQRLASTAVTAYELMPHAFGYDQANLKEDTVRLILKCFLISDPWGQMTHLATRVGLVALPLEETFKNAAVRRNRAAHVAHADTPQNDLVQFIKEAFAISIGFDALISSALLRLRNHDLRYLRGQHPLNSHSIKIRMVKHDGKVWREHIEGRARAVKIDDDLSVLLPLAKNRALNAGDLFVQFGLDGEVVFWDIN